MASNTKLEIIYGTGNSTISTYEIGIELKERAKEFSQLIIDACPVSRERSEALKACELAVIWAIQAVERNQGGE